MRKEMYKLLIFSNACSVVFTFVQLFVNLYIWKQNKSITDLVWFDLSQYVFWFLSFLIGASLFYKTKLSIVMNVSSVFAMILFFLLSFCTFTNYFYWILFAGGLYGLMKGVYSAGNNLAIGFVGKQKEYLVYFQQNDLFNRILNIVMPLLFGFLLFIFNYKILFIIMMFFSLVMLYLSNGLPMIKFEEVAENKKDVISGLSIKKILSLSQHRKTFLSCIMGGLYTEFQTIFLLYFTFKITSVELVVAALNVLYSLLTFGSIKIYRKSGLSENVWLFIGIALSFGGMGLAIYLKHWWLLIPNILLVLGNFFYRNTYYAQQFQAVNHETQLQKFQLTIWREFLLLFSRVIILVLILIFNQFASLTTYIYWLFGFVLINTLCVPFIHKSFLYEQKKVQS